MTILQRASQWYWWLLKFIQLQLFVTLFSLPILMYWGLPFSVLSPIGNLIFSPVLTAFLFLSSLIFFTEILSIPNQLIIWMLEKMTNFWLKVMFADNQRWLFGFSKPSAVFVFLIIAATIACMLIKKTRSIVRNILAMIIIFICFAAYVYKNSSQAPSRITTLPCNRGALTIISHASECFVIDPGYIGQTIAAPSWAQYTLMPAIIKQLGRTTIDHLILLHPSGLVFEAAERLCRKMNVKKIYLVYWQGAIKPSALRQYGKLKRAAQECGTSMIRIGNDPVAVAKNVTITPLIDTIDYQDISYRACVVSAQIDNQDITIYSAKYINKNHANSRTNQSPKVDE